MINSETNNRPLLTIIIFMAVISLYILLDLTISVSLNPIITSGFALVALALGFYILDSIPLKQRLLILGLVLFGIYALQFVDWNGRKQYIRDYNTIQHGMTVEEVDGLLAGYNKNVSPFASYSVQGDIQTGNITYLPTADFSTDYPTVSITFAGGRVIARSYYAN